MSDTKTYGPKTSKAVLLTLLDDVESRIAAAVAAEREECAQAAEAALAILMGPARTSIQLGSVRVRIQAIAAAIRARGGRS